MELTILDKYIIKTFIKNFLFALLSFILIFILVDLFESLDKFIDNKFTFFQILEFYYYFTPEIIKLITPVAMLLATLFTTGSMINYNELISLKNAGVSLLRFMYPFFIVGFVVTALSIYFNVWLVPDANKHKFHTERMFFGRHLNAEGLNKLYFQDSRNQIILIQVFDQANMTARDVSVLLFYPDSMTVLEKRLDAETMTWEENNWVFHNTVVREFEDAEKLLHYESLHEKDLIGFNRIILSPENIIRKQLKPDELDWGELKDYIENQKRGGQDAVKAEIDLYSKISFPFSSIIVIIFGISISTGSKKRKGLAMQFGISILISFIYLAFVKFSQAFGYNGDLSPMLTAWLANIFFAAFGIINLSVRNY